MTLTDRIAERASALFDGPGDIVSVHRVSHALGCSDDQARAAIDQLTRDGLLTPITTPYLKYDLWEVQ